MQSLSLYPYFFRIAAIPALFIVCQLKICDYRLDRLWRRYSRRTPVDQSGRQPTLGELDDNLKIWTIPPAGD